MEDGGKTSEEEEEIRLNIDEIGLDDFFNTEITAPIEPTLSPLPKTTPINAHLSQLQTPINPLPITKSPSTPISSTSPSTPKSGRPKNLIWKWIETQYRILSL